MTRPVVVLLIDDQPFIGELLKRLIGSEPAISLHACHEPQEAVSRARDLAPDVILLDLMMPSVDGMTLLRTLREDPRTSGARILMLSGTNDTVAQQKATAAGADGFLVKLPPRDALIAAIHGDGAADRDAGPAPSTEADNRLIAGFTAEASALLEKMRAAVGALDADSLRRASHSLRGASHAIGDERLAALSAQMEGHAARTPVRGMVLSVQMDEIDRAFREGQEPPKR
jgi:CheY-like chemotaxis protein